MVLLVAGALLILTLVLVASSLDLPRPVVRGPVSTDADRAVTGID